MKKKRKYVPRNGTAAIQMIQRVRNRNNRLWMSLLSLAVQAKPRQAKKILSGIAKNDQEITSWLQRI